VLPAAESESRYNRELNREFCRIRPSTAIFVSDQSVDSAAYSRIPYAAEQGISKCVSANSFRGTGKFSRPGQSIRTVRLDPHPLANARAWSRGREASGARR
jgi:hypothetical protein